MDYSKWDIPSGIARMEYTVWRSLERPASTPMCATVAPADTHHDSSASTTLQVVAVAREPVMDEMTTPSEQPPPRRRFGTLRAIEATASAFREWRRRTGHTREEVAVILEISISTVARWEQAKRSIPAWAIWTLAMTLRERDVGAMLGLDAHWGAPATVVPASPEEVDEEGGGNEEPSADDMRAVEEEEDDDAWLGIG